LDLWEIRVLNPVLRLKILIVDDDEDLRRLVGSTLKDERYDLMEANNGQDGLALAFTEAPDLILLDRQMPGMDGLEVLNKLRTNLTTRHIPVILLTAMGKVNERVQGLETGADDYVIKPFAPQELSARVEATLRRSRRDLITDPLTKLPGNPVLREELSRRLSSREHFSLCYADINDFKAYVDSYGFEGASEVIQRLGQLIYNCWIEHGAPDDFIGHIGGDDFFVLTAQESAEPLSIALVTGFNEMAGKYYQKTDRDRGYIQGMDRYGVQRRFPLLSLSVAIIDIAPGDFSDSKDLAAFAARCKEDVKQTRTKINHYRKRDVRPS